MPIPVCSVIPVLRLLVLTDVIRADVPYRGSVTAVCCWRHHLGFRYIPQPSANRAEETVAGRGTVLTSNWLSVILGDGSDGVWLYQNVQTRWSLMGLRAQLRQYIMR